MTLKASLNAIISWHKILCFVLGVYLEVLMAYSLLYAQKTIRGTWD